MRVFLGWILKIILFIWNKLLRICLIAKSHLIMKMPTFGTKNVLFAYFWLTFEKILSYLKSAPSILSKRNILRKKQKCLNLQQKDLIWYFWPKMLQLGNLRLDLKIYFHIWNHYPSTCLATKFSGKTKTWNFWPKVCGSSIFGSELYVYC